MPQHGTTHVLQQVAGEDKVGKSLVLGVHDVCGNTLPFLLSLVNEDNGLTNAHNGVHIVRIDDGRHVVLLGDAVQQFVNDK